MEEIFFLSTYKQQVLSKLAQKRQLTRWDGYLCIADLHGGAYECDHVSPYTKSASNMDADVMLVLQDWASSEYFERHDGVISDLVELGYDSSVDTNNNLKRLLKTHLNLDLQDTYATNLMPFIKQGGMSASIPMKVLVNAATEFALPQVKIVQPKIVVCFGLQAFNAISKKCYDLHKGADGVSKTWKQVDVLIKALVLNSSIND